MATKKKKKPKVRIEDFWQSLVDGNVYRVKSSQLEKILDKITDHCRASGTMTQLNFDMAKGEPIEYMVNFVQLEDRANSDFELSVDKME